MSTEQDYDEPAWRAQIRGSRIGNLVIILVTALAVGIGAWIVMRPDPDGAVSQVEVSGAAAAPRVGEAAPEFSATALDGSEVSLAGLRGRPVWLVFMATWCTGCRAETPDVQLAHEEAGDDGIEVIAIYVGESSGVVGDYVTRFGLSFAQLPDPQTRLSAAYGVMGVPAHYFIDAEGVIREARVGVLSATQMDESIAAASGR